MDAGKVALKGLRQNQLQLVFSEKEALDIGGGAIFDIGFLTKFPSTGTDSVKVGFKHKTLQEYLAAYYVVNTQGDKGLHLLMEFCCTSQRLMGSQIILEFISNMSTKIGKRIQKQIQGYASSWNSDDKVDPKSHTSFLISMLKGNKTLTFPLPAVVDIDLREFDFISHSVTRFLHRFLYRQNSTVEKFLAMDGTGVQKLILIVGEYNRMNVLQNTTTDSVNELTINYCNTWFEEDNTDLHEVMKKMKPGLLSITNCKRKLMDKATIAVILQQVHTLKLEKCDLEKDHLLLIIQEVKEIPFVHKSATIKSLRICNCGIQIDAKIAEVVSRLPDHTELDLSGNQITDKSACITLIHKSATMKSLSICNCGIQIDTEIAEAVSRLPDDIQLDLSGNKLTKMDPSLLPGVLLHMPEDKEVDMTECRISINVDIVKVLSKMTQLKSLKASHNTLTPEAASEFSMSQLKQLHLSDCGICDTVCVSLMISLSKHCPLLEKLDLTWNNLSSSGVWDIMDHIKHMKKLRKLVLLWNPCYEEKQCMVELKDALQKSNPRLIVYTEYKY